MTFSMIIGISGIQVLPCGVNFTNRSEEAAERIIASSATGVLALNDLVAMGLMRTLDGRSMRSCMPGDTFLWWDSTTFRLLAI